MADSKKQNMGISLPVSAMGFFLHQFHHQHRIANRSKDKKLGVGGDGRSAGHDTEDGGKERLMIVWLTIGLYST
jgi:hypothetical protein